MRILALLIAATAGLFIAFKGTFEGVPAVSETYVGYFDELRSVEGGSWSIANDIAVTADGVRTTGPDPYLVYDVADFEAEVNQMLFITMAAVGPKTGSEPTAALAHVFWRTADGEFSNEQSESFEIDIDSEEHVYAVSPSFRKPWEGTIAEFRIELPDQVGDVDFRIVDAQLRR